MSNALALKFGTQTEISQLLGVLPDNEVIEVIEAQLCRRIEADMRCEYMDRINQLEDELDEANEMASEVLEWQDSAIGLFRSMERALTVPWTEGVEMLRKAMIEHGGNIEDSPPPPSLPL